MTNGFKFLFPEPVVDRVDLRHSAREEALQSRLVHACATGDREAAKAMLSGFWPFVHGFEQCIDAGVRSLSFKPLHETFGKDRVMRFLADAGDVLVSMRKEEGSHAELWRENAIELGVDLYSVVPVLSISELMDVEADPVTFFCNLAGTEYMAEEVSRVLCQSDAFTSLFASGRWSWGDIHLAEHEGPSHLEIDEDLAAAYYHTTKNILPTEHAISGRIRKRQRMFGAAAEEVRVASWRSS